MEVPDYMHGNVQDILAIELDGAIRRTQWAVILKLVPYKDGNQWCILYGENLQSGIVGFGDTPEKAIYAFDEAMRNQG